MTVESYKKGDVTYYRLLIKCPICRQRGKNVEPQFWFHDIDNGEIFIGDDAKYECKKCGMNESILFGDFLCTNCSESKDNYIHISETETETVFADIVAAAGEIVEVAGIPWLQTLLANMEKERKMSN